MIKEKDLVYLLSSSAVLTLIWMGSSLYHSYSTSTIHEPLTTLIKPIAPTFNAQAIQQISQRNETVPTYERAGSSQKTPDTASPSAAVKPSLSLTPLPTIAPTEGVTP